MFAILALIFVSACLGATIVIVAYTVAMTRQTERNS